MTNDKLVREVDEKTPAIRERGDIADRVNLMQIAEHEHSIACCSHMTVKWEIQELPREHGGAWCAERDSNSHYSGLEPDDSAVGLPAHEMVGAA